MMPDKIIPIRSWDFGAVMKEYRIKKELNQSQLADLVGTSRNSIINWENNKRSPDAASIRELARILDIPLYELFGLPHPDFGTLPSGFEKIMLEQYRQLAPLCQEMARNIISSMLETETDARDRELLDSISLLTEQSTAAAAGKGNMEGQIPPTPIFIRKSRRSRMSDTVISITGHSMEPKYQDGDMVFVKYTQNVSDGDDVICAYHEGLIIKRIYGRKLYSLNSAIPFGDNHDYDDIQLIGKVVGVVEPEDLPPEEDIPLLEELFAEELRELNRKHGIE